MIPDPCASPALPSKSSSPERTQSRHSAWRSGSSSAFERVQYFPARWKKGAAERGHRRSSFRREGAVGDGRSPLPHQIAVGLELPLVRQSALEYQLSLSGKKVVLL